MFDQPQCIKDNSFHLHPPAPPSITNLWSANLTEASFCVFWSDQLHTKQSYQVVLRKGSDIITSWHSEQTMTEVRGLQPGVLYTVTVTPHACGSYGPSLSLLVKTGKNWFYVCF